MTRKVKDRFTLIQEYNFEQNLISLNAFSVSDTYDTFQNSIISLINNIKSTPFIYTSTEFKISYVIKSDIKIMCVIGYDTSYDYIALTNNFNLLISCLFYMSVEYRNIFLIEYLINNCVNYDNIKDIYDICNNYGLIPLKYYINSNCDTSLKNLSRKKVKRVYGDNIHNLLIPRELRDYITEGNILREIFYEENNFIDCFRHIRTSYAEFINVNKLSKINYRRIKPIGIKKIYHRESYKRKKHILYCEVTSYKYINKKPKYVAITFHKNIYCYNDIDNEEYAYINCKLLKRLPGVYDYIFEQSFYFGVTGGTYDTHSDIITNKIFTFSHEGGDGYYPRGFYHLNLELSRKTVLFTKRFKYYRYYSFIYKRVTIPIKRKKIIKRPKSMMRNFNYVPNHILQKYIKLKTYR